MEPGFVAHSEWRSNRRSNFSHPILFIRFILSENSVFFGFFVVHPYIPTALKRLQQLHLTPFETPTRPNIYVGQGLTYHTGMPQIRFALSRDSRSAAVFLGGLYQGRSRSRNRARPLATYISPLTGFDQSLRRRSEAKADRSCLG